MPKPDVPSRIAPQRNTSALAILARVYWMLLGNIIVVLSAVMIGRSPQGLSLHDAAFWAGSASLLVVRYVDVTRLQGTTAEGEPATMAHWRRYAVTVAVVAGVAWVTAHGMAFALTR